MLPKISVVTPSYNQGQYIEETILSIIHQDYDRLEYIVIDGGSTDNTVEVIKKYDQYITYWVSEKDGGQSEAINKGFTKATGDIVCWLNSDDIFLPGALKKVANAFLENTNTDVINGNLLLIDKDSMILSTHYILKQKNWYAEHGIFYVSQPSMFWRRNIFESIGLLKEDFHAAMDRDFLIRVFKNGCNIGHLETTLAGFRIHDASKSSAGWENVHYLRDLKEIQRIYGKRYGKSPRLFFKIIYGCEKLVKGVYLKKWLFTLKWKGKPVREFNLTSN